MEYDVITTKLQKGTPKEFAELRKLRLIEALSFKTGSKEKPAKHIIESLDNNIDVYFLKPGKEVFNIKRPNVNDMTPMVNDKFKLFDFQKLWLYLHRIDSLDEELFKQTLTIVYRICFMIDFKEIKKDSGIVRFRPSKEIMNFILKLNEKMSKIDVEFNLIEMFHFIDILGWNEDIKYHIENGFPTFKGNFGTKVGRVNTILSCIGVPYSIHLFIKNVADSLKRNNEIDHKIVLDTMQKFARSRGVSTPSQAELVEWLSPYIEK